MSKICFVCLFLKEKYVHLQQLLYFIAEKNLFLLILKSDRSHDLKITFSVKSRNGLLLKVLTLVQTQVPKISGQLWIHNCSVKCHPLV